MLHQRLDLVNFHNPIEIASGRVELEGRRGMRHQQDIFMLVADGQVMAISSVLPNLGQIIFMEFLQLHVLTLANDIVFPQMILPNDPQKALVPENAVGPLHGVPVRPLNPLQIIDIRRVHGHKQRQLAGTRAGRDKGSEVRNPLKRVRVISHPIFPDDVAQGRRFLAGHDVDHADHAAGGRDEGDEAAVSRLADLHLGQIAPDVLLPGPGVVVAFEGPVDGIFVPGRSVAGEDPDCFGLLIGDGDVVGRREGEDGEGEKDILQMHDDALTEDRSRFVVCNIIIESVCTDETGKEGEESPRIYTPSKMRLVRLFISMNP